MCKYTLKGNITHLFAWDTSDTTFLWSELKRLQFFFIIFPVQWAHVVSPPTCLTDVWRNHKGSHVNATNDNKTTTHSRSSPPDQRTLDDQVGTVVRPYLQDSSSQCSPVCTGPRPGPETCAYRDCWTCDGYQLITSQARPFLSDSSHLLSPRRLQAALILCTTAQATSATTVPMTTHG